MITMVDRLLRSGLFKTQAAGSGNLADLRPSTFRLAIWRAIRGRCPRCDSTSLFRRFLKPVPRCVACGEDWQARSSDDFPPYIVILLLGHVIAPGMISFEMGAHPPLWIHLAIWLPLAAILGAALIQPAKGGVMALQWWLADGRASRLDAVPDLEKPLPAQIASPNEADADRLGSSVPR
jgi:uncharacterized protein (DUF983 family)